jgi:predicted transcriptional regulator
VAGIILRGMTPTELVKHYGSQVAAAKALGISRAAVQKWVKTGRIPPVRYWHVMAMVKGWKPL